MIRKITLAGIFIILLCRNNLAYPDGVLLQDMPQLPKDAALDEREDMFGYRGRVGAFVLPPSRVGVYFDDSENYVPAGKEVKEPTEAPKVDTGVKGGVKEFMREDESIKITYEKAVGDKTFCGAYIVIKGDLSKYKTMTFMIKGKTGEETFEIGMNDVISNRREDAVMIGSVHRFLSDGITNDWQEVKIPLSDFYGPDLSKVYSIIFHFNEEGKGTFWIDDIRFHEELLVDREKEIRKKGYLLLDDFDHATTVNLLARKTNTYKKLPSVCRMAWDKNVRYGDKGRSLKLIYDKKSAGWCGYYTLLNQIDGEYYDLSGYDRVSFMVRGEKGGESFELGMADKNWLIIGDSLKAGQIEKYLPSGVTTEWQEAVIPLKDFGMLDFSEMGSFVINFNKKQSSVVYIDDIKFHLTKSERKEGGGQ
ncbi:MAG: hypothetical protein ABH847_03500 [Candidatus Omnitrophota bacterium]